MCYKKSKTDHDYVMEYLQRHGYGKVAKKLQKVTNCRRPGKHEDPDQDETIWVYDYLVKNGYRKVANKLAYLIEELAKGTRKRKMLGCENPDKKVFKNFEQETNRRQTGKHTDPNQHPTIWVYDYLVKNGYRKVANKFAHVILDSSEKDSTEKVTKATRKRKLSGCGKTELKVSKTDPDNIAFTLVSDYLNKHDYQAFAQELQNEVRYCSKLHLQGLDLPTLLKLSKSTLTKVPEKQNVSSEASEKRKLSESQSKPTKKPEKQTVSSKSDKRKLCESQTKTKVFKLSNPDQLDDLNQKVTINDLFVDKLDDLKTLPQDSEIPKTVKFILDSNIKVRKSMRDTVHISDFNRESILRRFPYIRTEKLSSVKYGDTTEESLILKQWDDLVAKVPIYVPKKFLIQIKETILSWCQLLLGAYLSLDLTENHRSAIQIFRAFTFLKGRKGTYTPEEDELILALDLKNGQNMEWQNLAMEFGRTRQSLSTRLHYLKHVKGKSALGCRFTLEEDRKILEYINERFDLSSPESLKSVKRIELKNLTNVMQRSHAMIYDRWIRRLMPIVLTYLYGAPEIQWKEEFLKYVVEQKVMSLAAMNWTDVLQKWPFQNKHSLTKSLDDASWRFSKDKKGPLYQQVSAYLAHPVKKPTSKSLQDQRREIRNIFDEIRFGKQ